MKNSFFITLFFGLIFTNVWGQTSLSPGDLMIVTVNADDDKNFDFVPLIDLDNGTVIYFTDNAWDGSTLNTNEGTINYTASSVITAGTVISFPGSVGGDWSSTGGGFNCSASGDNILVYQGSSESPSFILGVGWASGTPWISSGTVSTNDSFIPSELSEVANTIVSLGTSDNYQYNTANGTSGTKSELLALMADGANFNSDNTTAFTALSTSFTVNSGGTPDPEPTNHVSSFTAALSTPTYSSIDLTWNDNNGAQAASGFLILANTSGTFPVPADGTPQSDDTDLSDNSGQVNVGSGVGQYSFSGLPAETQYYFKIYPYTNSGSDIDYKTDGTVPTADATTDSAPDLPNAWINELHYDNDGADEGEFVEIIIEDPANYTISNFSLDLCNGSGGTSYDSKSLDNFTAGTPFTVNGKTFNIYYLTYPPNGIQNGDPDGLCLSYSGSLIQFLSYGGTFTAVGGPADGVLSTDIGITQNGNPVGSSIGLTGTGTQYTDFTWTTFSTASAGSQNPDQALPVELTSFTASVVKNSIQLKWKTATEIDNYGFEVERTYLQDESANASTQTKAGKSANASTPLSMTQKWVSLGFISGHGTSSSPKNYEFTDKSITENGVYSYRLKQVDNNGTYKYSDIVEISFMKSYPEKFALEQNYPNPFNPVTHINFVIPSLSTNKAGGVEGLVSIRVYDVLGNEIAELVNEPKSPGTYEVVFDGSKFVSGIYFYQLSLDGLVVDNKKMLLLK